MHFRFGDDFYTLELPSESNDRRLLNLCWYQSDKKRKAIFNYDHILQCSYIDFEAISNPSVELVFVRFSTT